MRGTNASTASGKALEAAGVAMRGLAILLLALLTALIVAQVVGRNLFNLGMPWADELARFCGVALVFLCIPLLALRGQHVAVDMVPMMLAPARRRIVAIAVELMTSAFSAMSLWALHAFLGRAWKFATPTLGIPNWVYYAPATVGFLVLFLVTLLRLAILLRGGQLRHDEEIHVS